jgi:hypothetical protein
MNERIRELAIDCAGQKEWDFPKPPASFTFNREELAKFAELIVLECAKVADIADENKCEWIGGNILTHFGVEE